jgi:hypothetical protein
MLRLLAETYAANRPLDPQELLDHGYDGGVVSRGIWQEDEG